LIGIKGAVVKVDPRYFILSKMKTKEQDNFSVYFSKIISTLLIPVFYPFL